MTTKEVKHIQINVWLGIQQRIEVLADERIKIHACRDLDPPIMFTREDATDDPTGDDVAVLIQELGAKISDALKTGKRVVEICVEDEDDRIVACSSSGEYEKLGAEVDSATKKLLDFAKSHNLDHDDYATWKSFGKALDKAE